MAAPGPGAGAEGRDTVPEGLKVPDLLLVLAGRGSEGRTINILLSKRCKTLSHAMMLSMPNILMLACSLTGRVLAASDREPWADAEGRDGVQRSAAWPQGGVARRFHMRKCSRSLRAFSRSLRRNCCTANAGWIAVEMHSSGQ